MKKTILILTILLVTFFANAQMSVKTGITEGTVHYEQTVKLEIKLEGEAAKYASALPKERRSNKVLVFTKEASLYKNDKATNDETGNESGTVMIKMTEPNNAVYTDITKNKQIEQKEFMTRTFLIEGDFEKDKWKLTGKRKTILGYECQQAILKKDEKEITAWYAPTIPVSTGPHKFGGLPGLILALDVNNGKNTIVAKSINPEKPDKSILVKPKKGKKVSEEEFKKIVDEKLKEMGVEGSKSGGHTMMIKIQK